MRTTGITPDQQLRDRFRPR